MNRPHFSWLLAAVLVVGFSGLASHAQTEKSETLVDPNAATREQLIAVADLTPAVVDALLAARPFAGTAAFDAFLLEQKLTREQLGELYKKIFLPIDLNTATRAEILLIPGVGNRMAHEFEEYRPYKSIEQFRKEIGKYVDKSEVARLERYVMIK